VIEKVLEESPLPAVTSAVELTTGAPEVHDILEALPFDLPLPLIGGVVISAVVVGIVLTGRNNGPSRSETAPSNVKTDSSSDVSIPYDAAAMLAYEEAGKPGDWFILKRWKCFSDFKQFFCSTGIFNFSGLLCWLHWIQLL
jgi:hypothetical protein